MHKDLLPLPPPAVPVPYHPAKDAGLAPNYLEQQAYGGGAYPEDPDSGGGLLDYWRILRRGKWILLLVAFAGVVAAVLLTLPQKPLYLAGATLEIQPINEDFMNTRQLNPVEQSPITDVMMGDIPTQVQILQSNTILDRALSRLDPTHMPASAAGPAKPDSRPTWRRLLESLKPKPPLPPRQAALARAVDSLKIKSTPDTRIVSIECDSPDPNVAAGFANALADEYIKQNLEVRWNMSQRTSEWLGKELDGMRLKLERSEEAMQAYARTAGLLLSSESGTKFSEAQLSNLQAELNKAQADRSIQQSRYEMADTKSPDALPDVVDSLALRAYQAKLTDLRQQLADLKGTYTPEHAKVKHVEAQIEEVQASFDRDRASIIARIKTDYDQALSRERLLTADYARQTGLVTSDAEKSVQYNILKREVDSSRTLYESMLGRVKESGIAAAMRASNIRVVDDALPPTAPYKPSFPRNAALGLFGGLFLGAAVLIVRDRCDRTIRNPEDASLYLGVSELGVIPAASHARRHSSYGRKRVRGAGSSPAGPNGSSAVLLAPAPGTLDLITFTDPSSMMAESFRTTLTSILFSGQNGTRPRTLVFTSAHPSEGKTTVVANLGIALAEAGQKVLLIDGDMRKPRLQTIFNVSEVMGLADLLRDRTTPAVEALATMVQESKIPGLSVLPAGPPTSAATNLLYSPQLAELIRTARSIYDMVLVDTPPVLNIADARVLGRLSDAVVMVVRSRKTTRDVLKNTCQRFSEDGTKVLGVVLNDWDPRSGASSYGYSNYYQGYNSYASAKSKQ
jgi:succinoglycan biosynthesis transport protein ExoP